MDTRSLMYRGFDRETAERIAADRLDQLAQEEKDRRAEDALRVRDAAPDLLAALKAYEAARIRRIRRIDGSVTLEMDFQTLDAANHATAAARAAIAKATGEQS